TLRLQKPQPGGIALNYDRPWEDRFCFYTTVLKDGGKYLMYYRSYFGGVTTKGEGTGYAESTDGIHWTKPDLGLVEFEGSRKNNLIEPPGKQFTAFIDGRAGVPAAERFKGNCEDKPGLVGWTSGDGIHWKKVQEAPIVPRSLVNHFDSQNVMFWSEVAVLCALCPPLRGKEARAGPGHLEGLHPLDGTHADDIQRHQQHDPVAAPLHQPDSSVLPRPPPLHSPAGALSGRARSPDRAAGRRRGRGRRRRRGARHRRRRPREPPPPGPRARFHLLPNRRP